MGVESNQRKSGKSGAGSVERLEPPAGCCSRGVYRHVSADASMLSRTGLGLTTLVRCVGLNTDLRSRGSGNSTSHSMGKGNIRRWSLRENTRRQKTVHTQDFHEPLNTLRKGGGEEIVIDSVVDTTALFKKSGGEDGAAEK